MVEFVILLTVIMILISGMLYFFRLHLYQFWAQQEARYLAFEETWVPKAYYEGEGKNADEILENSAPLFIRPGVVSNLGVTRSRTNFGSMTDLLARFFKDDLPEVNMESDEPTIIETAYASERTISDQFKPKVRHPQQITPSILPALDDALEIKLRSGGFGEKFCDIARYKINAVGLRASTTQFGSLRCAQEQERKVASYLAKRADIPSMFRDFTDRVEGGSEVGEAIQTSLEVAIAEGFYTFFSNEVENRFNDAPQEIISGRVDAATTAADASILRMMGDLRYIGSTAAIAAILAEGVAVGSTSSTNRNAQTELTLENSLNSVLHIDASDILPIIGDGYLMNPTYLPIPPVFGAMAGGFFSGPMQAVLSLDPSLVGPMIDNSVKRVSITYDSANGLFPAATRRFRTGAKLSARFAIDTDPWHMERRVNRTGPYRDKGAEFDMVDNDSEEGLLRRRVNGLWLFPTPPDAFFDPILAFVGLDELNTIVSAFRPFGNILSQIKSFVTNNPLTELFNTLSQIPVIGNLVPRLPVWPVVRPDAYPKSVEMKDDKKMGNSREFDDYIDEQRDFNPDPRPTFN